MLLPYTKIIGGFIVDLRGFTNLGNIFELVYSDEKLAVSGVLTKTGGFFGRKIKAVSSVDILEISSKTVAALVDDEDVIVDLDEVVRLKKNFEDGYFGIGQSVVTQSGKSLGKVYDLLIDSVDLTIHKFYVKDLFSDRIIATKQIVGWDGPKKLVVKDNTETIKVASPTPETVSAS